MGIDGITEPERRLRTLVDWLRHREWAPAGADVCADDIEAMLGRSQLTWTTERPTVPGWYWLRGVSWRNGVPSLTIRRLKNVPNEWRVEFSGPIPEPAESSEGGGTWTSSSKL